MRPRLFGSLLLLIGALAPACDCGEPARVPPGAEDAQPLDAEVADATTDAHPDVGLDAGFFADAQAAADAMPVSDGASSSDASAPDASALDATPSFDSGPTDATSLPVDAGIGWSRMIGADGWDEVRGLLVTPQGEVIVAGSIEGQVDVGCGPLNGRYRDIFLGAFSAESGACLWSRAFGTPNEDRAGALAQGSGGELYLGGYFNDFGNATLDLGGSVLAGSGANRDVPFVARFDLTPSGPTHLWSLRFLGDGNVTRLAPVTGGGVVAAGTFYQSLQVAGQYVTRCCPDADGAWLAAINGGTAAWGNGARITGAGIDSVYPGELALVGGDALFGASAGGPAEIGTATLAAGAFTARFAQSDGRLTGLLHPGAPGKDPIFISRMLPDPAGGFYVAGTASEGQDLGNGPLVGYAAHIFVGHTDAALQLTRVQTFHIEYGGVTSLARDASGRIIVLGTFRGARNFGGFSLSSGSVNDGAEDPLLLVLSPDLGTVLHAERFHTPGEDFMGGYVAVTPGGSWIVAQHLVESIEIRGQTFNGPRGWNVLLFELR